MGGCSFFYSQYITSDSRIQEENAICSFWQSDSGQFGSTESLFYKTTGYKEEKPLFLKIKPQVSTAILDAFSLLDFLSDTPVYRCERV